MLYIFIKVLIIVIKVKSVYDIISQLLVARGALFSHPNKVPKISDEKIKVFPLS